MSDDIERMTPDDFDAMVIVCQVCNPEWFPHVNLEPAGKNPIPVFIFDRQNAEFAGLAAGPCSLPPAGGCRDYSART